MAPAPHWAELQHRWCGTWPKRSRGAHAVTPPHQDSSTASAYRCAEVQGRTGSGTQPTTWSTKSTPRTKALNRFGLVHFLRVGGTNGCRLLPGREGNKSGGYLSLMRPRNSEKSSSEKSSPFSFINSPNWSNSSSYCFKPSSFFFARFSKMRAVP